jgi:hypothetical protein
VRELPDGQGKAGIGNIGHSERGKVLPIIDRLQSSILAVFGEGTFENGDPTEKHDADTPDQASKEHGLENVLAPEH